MKRPRPRALRSQLIALVVGQAARSYRDEDAVEIKTSKSLPTYSAVLPKYKILSEGLTRVRGREVKYRVKAYPPNNVLVEITSEVANIFSRRTHDLRESLLEAAEAKLRKLNPLEGFKEEYAIFTVAGYRGEPQQFLKHRREIVGLIRSENLPLSPSEVDATIRDSSLQYTAHDLTVLDWDGAFCFDPRGEWHETIELLEVANVHLLRLRVLDRELDQRLENVSELLSAVGRGKIPTGRVEKQMADLLVLQTQSVSEFSHSGRDIQLIGDWYAARLYNLISRKFHLEEWRRGLREELENLRTLYHTAADHFGISAQTRAETIQIVLWFVLLFGWLVVLIGDFINAFGK